MAYHKPPNSIIAGTGLKQAPVGSIIDPAGNVPVSLDMDIASYDGLGCVQVGANIDVTPEGIISVTFPKYRNCHCCDATKLIDRDYHVSIDDYYIGVDSTGPVTITLPRSPESGTQYVIKAEMKPPMGNRKITIVGSDQSTIDGKQSYVITGGQYGSVRLIYNHGDWFII